jgi:hypothetical protein
VAEYTGNCAQCGCSFQSARWGSTPAGRLIPSGTSVELPYASEANNKLCGSCHRRLYPPKRAAPPRTASPLARPEHAILEQSVLCSVQDAAPRLTIKKRKLNPKHTADRQAAKLIAALPPSGNTRSQSLPPELLPPALPDTGEKIVVELTRYKELCDKSLCEAVDKTTAQQCGARLQYERAETVVPRAFCV